MKEGNSTKGVILFIIVSIILSICMALTSCGSIEKYKASKDTKKETEKETASGSETKTTAFKDFFSYEPYDNTKPMIIGRDTVVNTRIINNKETIYTHSKDTLFIKEKKVQEVQENIKHKESDNTTLFIWLGLGGLLLILLFMFFAMMYMVKQVKPV